MSQRDYISLKFGTLKAWDINTKPAQECLKRYFDGGVSISCALQSDSEAQTQALLDLIDAADVETVHLDWDNVEVTKQEAKLYVMGFGSKQKDTPA